MATSFDDVQPVLGHPSIHQIFLSIIPNCSVVVVGKIWKKENPPKEGKEGGEKCTPLWPGNWTLNHLHASQESVAAHQGRYFDKLAFPWV